MSVNSYLNDLAERVIVRDNEKNKIQASVNAIKERLEQHFTSEVERVFLFGSFKRKTIISRKFDENSDVDIMVVFRKNDSSLPLNPQTYLKKLRDFIESRYPNSICRQSFPAVVLELNHIKFDLVPAIIDDWNNYKIPNKQNWDWTTTNPNDLDRALTNNQTLRRLVRVAKIWNAKQEIDESYSLEKWIAQQYFCGDLSEHFYHFCQIFPFGCLSQDKQRKIQRLKYSAIQAKNSDDENCIKDLFERV